MLSKSTSTNKARSMIQVRDRLHLEEGSRPIEASGSLQGHPDTALPHKGVGRKGRDARALEWRLCVLPAAAVGFWPTANASQVVRGRARARKPSGIDSESSTMLPQTSYNTWKTIEGPNAAPGDPEKSGFVQVVCIFRGLRSVYLL